MRLDGAAKDAETLAEEVIAHLERVGVIATDGLAHTRGRDEVTA
ncbi:hypothetical protein MAHJHV54_28270 [Mycobacterium avium subsp. hominissuis]